MDDFLIAGSQEFHNTVIDHVQTQFQLSKESLSQMLYTGTEYSQDFDEKIVIHQTEYTAKVEPLHLTNMSKYSALDAFLLRSLLIEVYKLDDTHIPVISITDSSSLHESLHFTNVIDDKRLYIDIFSVHDTLSRNEISEVKLTSSQDQLAVLPMVQLQQNV